MWDGDYGVILNIWVLCDVCGVVTGRRVGSGARV